MNIVDEVALVVQKYDPVVVQAEGMVVVFVGLDSDGDFALDGRRYQVSEGTLEVISEMLVEGEWSVQDYG